MTLPKGYKKPDNMNNSITKYNPDLFSRPIVGANMLDFHTYEIDFLKENKNYSGLNMMEIRPIEFDASILFYNKKTKKGPLLPISKIKDIRVVNQSKGLILKKEDLLVEIELDVENADNILLFNMDDKKIDEFIKTVNLIQKMLKDDMLWTSRLINIKTDIGINSSLTIFPMAPFLSPGEKIVWNNIITKGMINKKIQWLDLVTDYRTYQYDYINHVGNFVLMSAVEDVVVNNQRRVSDSTRHGNYVRSGSFVVGSGNNKATSMTVGDVSILAYGKPYIVFKNISDPNGLARIIKSMAKQCSFTTENITIVKESNDHIYDKSTFDTTLDNHTINKNNSNIICKYCSKENFPNSKFCIQCGKKIEILNKCNKCHHVNVNDAIFCNQCGNRLSN